MDEEEPGKIKTKASSPSFILLIIIIKLVIKL
jgi:hypothetical protein